MHNTDQVSQKYFYVLSEIKDYHFPEIKALARGMSGHLLVVFNTVVTYRNAPSLGTYVEEVIECES